MTINYSIVIFNAKISNDKPLVASSQLFLYTCRMNTNISLDSI